MGVGAWLMGLALCGWPAESAAAGGAGNASSPASWLVFVGTYTGGKSEGIYVFRLDATTGEATSPRLAAEAVNPSFLAIHPNRKYLYAVSEIQQLNGRRTGAVAAFAVDAASGRLRPINKQPSGGAGPCHLVVDHSGGHVLVANYGGGSVAVLPIGEGGRLGEMSAFVQHQGRSVNPRRQTAPHAHSINVAPDNRFAFAADLGLDKVLVYRFDAAQGSLQPADPPFASVQPGAGPRHFAFHPSGKFAYVINELHSTVTAFEYEPHSGRLTAIQTISTLPSDFRGNNTTAEVQVHPSGRFVYGSNRGHDSIAIFRVDAETGRLTAAGHASTRGKTPRNFGLDPQGRFLLAANQATDTVVVFRIDPHTGGLTPTGTVLEIATPVCIKMMPAP